MSFPAGYYMTLMMAARCNQIGWPLPTGYYMTLMMAARCYQIAYHFLQDITPADT